MNKESLIQEFEATVNEITNRCLTKLENPNNNILEIFDDFQKSVADETPKIIHKAIINNVYDRNTLIKSLAEISIKHATKLKSKV
ncbi:hypothetical protein [Aquimarina celericrescens]|uniref:Uncharacterized protein n=1 Tax=Aquimarina celericrescens TaxID=1964542 RepID=A0ABW5AW53_9FLAO|nr:hypothetical protein [Aquimarina celericrescens]